MLKKNLLLTIIFGGLIVLLLVGTRLGFVYAGGSGYQAPIVAHVVHGTGGTFARGSTVETHVNEKLLLEIAGARIGLYENTSLELKMLTSDRIELRITKGRIAVAARSSNQSITVSSNRVDATTLGGSFSFVNYDFLQKVSIIPLSGIAGVVVNGESASILAGPVDVSEIAPYELTETTFTPAGSAAEEFYTWFIDQRPADIPE